MKVSKPRVSLLCLLVLVLSLFYADRPPEERCPLAVKYFHIWKADPKMPNGAGAAFRAAIQYFNANRSKIKNTQYLTIIDYTKPSTAKRMYIVNLKTGEITAHLVAHGKNSGYTYAVDFSNQVDSLKSCKGFFLTGRKYTGAHGTSLTLYGLQKRLNDNALQRGIIIHGSSYVSSSNTCPRGRRVGRSWGCPAVSRGEVDQIVNKIKNGSLLYIHGSS